MIVSAEAFKTIPDSKLVGIYSSTLKEQQILISVKMRVTDNPPAYSDQPAVPLRSHLPPPTVDQVHIFSRREDIKGTLASTSFSHLLISVQERTTSTHTSHRFVKRLKIASERGSRCRTRRSGHVKPMFALIWVQLAMCMMLKRLI